MDQINKLKAITTAYQIATLTYPAYEVLELLDPIPLERSLELLLILRQSRSTIRSPVNFLKRAIKEGWSAEVMPERIGRY